jgi:rSAM/selenodomain-associated transferase 1
VRAGQIGAWARHLVVMAKEPVAGRVKTRLARDIGLAAATGFARTTARNVIQRLDQPRRWRLHLAVDAPGRLASRALPAGPARFAQTRGDLGRRMQAIMDRRLAGPVVIVGADIPGLEARHIAAAFAALGRHDAVFGPARDGGYWLVGFKRFPCVPRAFVNVRWSSAHALADTMRNLEGRRIALLDILDDVDTGADLRRNAPLVGRRIVPRDLTPCAGAPRGAA